MKALLAVGLVLALAACQPKPDGSSSMEQNVEAACAAVDIGYVVFKSFEDKVSPTVAVKLEASYIASKRVCLNPPANKTEWLIAVLRAAADFNNALAQAKATAG